MQNGDLTRKKREVHRKMGSSISSAAISGDTAMTLVFESSAPAAPRSSGRTTRARPDMSGEGLYRCFKVFDQFDPQKFIPL